MPSTEQNTEDARWAAIVSRDATNTDAFFYAVRTTGVYCRPTCRSRQPRRENVEFFGSIQAAEKSGYRACQRCRPDQPAHKPHLDVVLEACRRIEASEDKLSLDQLAQSTGLSKFHFQRIFKSIVGVTPKQYATANRFQRFRNGLAASPSVTDAIYTAGFSSPSRAYENSDAKLGMTPQNFRSGGAGLNIRYAIAQTSLGSMLVAATARGICSIAFGDSQEQLIHDLEQSFPRATFTDAAPDFLHHVEKILHLVEQPSRGLDLPLDIQGTSFQQRVWQKLREIPSGQTITYSELAKRIGRPKSVRAVASACAANKLAVAIPCHRAINKNGRLSGYRWGKHRKEELLRKEKSPR